MMPKMFYHHMLTFADLACHHEGIIHLGVNFYFVGAVGDKISLRSGFMSRQKSLYGDVEGVQEPLLPSRPDIGPDGLNICIRQDQEHIESFHGTYRAGKILNKMRVGQVAGKCKARHDKMRADQKCNIIGIFKIISSLSMVPTEPAKFSIR